MKNTIRRFYADHAEAIVVGVIVLAVAGRISLTIVRGNRIKRAELFAYEDGSVILLVYLNNGKGKELKLYPNPYI